MHTVTVAYGRRSLESNFDVELAEGSRDTPRVGLLVFVVERLDLLRLLGSTQARWVGELEELWRKLDEPFRIDRRHFTHVFLGRHHQLMVNHPVTDDRTAAHLVNHPMTDDRTPAHGKPPCDRQQDTSTSGKPANLVNHPMTDNRTPARGKPPYDRRQNTSSW